MGTHRRSPSQRPLILLVEDNYGDVRLVFEATKIGSVECDIEVVKSGEKALDFLLRRGDFASARAPAFVLLDLNLPGMDGREVLQEVKRNPTLRQIPIVVLTSSDALDDIQRSYQNQANCYVKKPSEFDAFVTTIADIQRFWLDVALIPHH